MFKIKEILLKRDHQQTRQGNLPVGDDEAKECSKLGKELKLTEKEWYARAYTGDHSVENADTQVAERFRDPGVCVALGNLVGMS